MKELGDQFDIHTGGVDHIAVHHENEIAQSEAATGNHPFVKYWLHGEFLVTDKRMGKSEGNAITLQQVIDKGIDPLAFRYLCLQTHYRKPLSFTWESLIAAQSGLDRLWNLITNWTNEAETGKTEKGDRFITDFQSAISDDLNTPRAMQVLHTMLASSETTGRRFDILKDFDRVLALDLNPEAAKEHITPVGSELEKLLKDYETARREKRFSDSDIIRKEFAAKGIIVEDSPDGTSRLRKE
jgi:cysteinyl-tRNA synthetase